MRKLLIGIVSLWFAFAPAHAANVNIDGLPAASSVGGTDLHECEQAGTNNKCTSAQFAAYIYSLATGDCTISGTGAVVCTKTNGAAFSALATTAPGTGIATWLTTPTSANLAAALTDETGTGAAVFGTAPTISSLNATVAMTLAWITGSTQCLQVNSSGVVSGTGSVCGGSGSTGANPTATASDTAVNGSATTFMRSDAAPAIQKATTAQFGVAKADGVGIGATGGLLSNLGVTSVSATCGTSGGGTGAVTISATSTDSAVATTTYTLASGDCSLVKRFTNASAVTVTVPAPTGFASGYFGTIKSDAANTAGLTITPSGTTIDGSASSIALAVNQSLDLYVNASGSFTTLPGKGGSGSPTGSAGGDLSGTYPNPTLSFASASAAAAAADADTFPTNQGAGTLKQTLAAIKTWIKSWIAFSNLAGSATVSQLPAGQVNHPGYGTGGLWYAPMGIGSITAGGAASLTTAYCLPGQIGGNASVTVEGLAIRLSTAGTSNIQLAIYNDAAGSSGAPHRPSTLVVASASIVNTSINASGSVTATAVAPGFYWFCIQTADTTARWWSGTTTQDTMMSLIGSTSFANVTTMAVVAVSTPTGITSFGTWPSFSGATFTEGNQIGPAVAFQLQ